MIDSERLDKCLIWLWSRSFSLDFARFGEVYIHHFASANHGPATDFELFTPIADDDGE